LIPFVALRHRSSRGPRPTGRLRGAVV
jgi:hypothetical protein